MKLTRHYHKIVWGLICFVFAMQNAYGDYWHYNTSHLASLNVKPVYHRHSTYELSSGQISDIRAWVDYWYPDAIEIEPPTRYYNYHYFAWNKYQGMTIWTSQNDRWKYGEPAKVNKYWVNYPNEFMNDGGYCPEIGENSYIQTTDNSAPILTYHYTSSADHSARRLSGSNDVVSKWGEMGTYRHNYQDCPYVGPYYKFKPNPKIKRVGSDATRCKYTTIEAALQAAQSGDLAWLIDSESISTNVTIKWEYLCLCRKRKNPYN